MLVKFLIKDQWVECFSLPGFIGGNFYLPLRVQKQELIECRHTLLLIQVIKLLQDAFPNGQELITFWV